MGAGGSALDEAPASAAMLVFAPPEEMAGSSARSKSVGISKAATADVAMIRKSILILVS
jgi:hypothetical protein